MFSEIVLYSACLGASPLGTYGIGTYLGTDENVSVPT
jgi:hypothetical protein